MGKIKIENVLYLITAIILVLAFIVITNPRIIGNVVEEQYEEYSDNLNIKFNSSTIYTWTPKNNGEITSIKITGTVSGKLGATVYFENKLTFDSDKFRGTSLLTGNVINDDEINETISQKELGEENETITNSTEEINETIANITEEITENITINESIPENLTKNFIENIIEKPIENSTTNKSIPEEDLPQLIEIEEKIEITKFVDICEKTCALQNIPKKENYSIKIATINTQLKIEKITYKIKKESIIKSSQNDYQERIEESIQIDKIGKEEKNNIRKKSKIEKDPMNIIKILIGIIAIISITFIIMKHNLPKKKKIKRKRK